uniref:Uncharacterized protein n=1 Tax=Arundo donax TaxID=35708 RepID=A0A0A9GZU4_ARUDO
MTRYFFCKYVKQYNMNAELNEYSQHKQLND